MNNLNNFKRKRKKILIMMKIKNYDKIKKIYYKTQMKNILVKLMIN